METMDRDRAKAEIRTRIDCRGYLQESKNGLYCCPFCHSGTGPNATGAVKYYADTNTAYCHACKKTMDVIDLYRENTGADFNTALSELADLAGIRIENDFAAQNTKTQAGAKMQQRATETKTEGTADYTEYYKACGEALLGPDGTPGIEYLQSRGVLEAALSYRAGYDSKERRIIIPCSRSFYIARSIDPDGNPKYKNPPKSTGASGTILFNGDILYKQDVQEVFITEGTFDALSIIMAGGQAIALNGAGNAKLLLDPLDKKPTAATLILCPDNDPEERTRAEVQKEFENIAGGLQRLQIPFITADINKGYKDANEALQQAGLYTLVDTVRDTIREAQAHKAKLQHEQYLRTGPGMVDAFLETVRTRRFEPVPTGIEDLDYALYGGFTRQTLVLLGAAPAAGKTALAAWLFEGMAKQGHTVLYLNLEMSREQMIARSISRIAAQNGERISPAQIKQGYKWTWQQEAVIVSAAEQYKKEIAPQMVYNPDGVTADLDSILEYIELEAEQAEAAGKPAPLVCIDYLQLIGGKDREDDTSIIKRAVSSFKRYAIKHNTIVFAIMAQNRPANKSGTVTMESGRDTSALEYSADLQLGLAFTRCLYRDGYETKPNREALTQDELHYVTLVITKCRDGMAGKEIDLYFDGETMTYTQISKAEEPPEPEQKSSWIWDNARRV